MTPTLVENAKEVVRPVVANFSPSLWGDKFIDYNFDTQVAENISKAIELLKDDVKNKLIITHGGSNNVVETMNVIDTLERLGISYHFENEIEQNLEQFFNLQTNYEDESYDLYTVALHFRLFRQHGHRISCDVFSKFVDRNGKFHEALKSDARGLLSLYEAAHLRGHGENMLEEALTFAMVHLKSIAPNLESHRLRKQVEHALVQSLHFGYPRIEARNFISVYDDDESLLKFAKLDYNFLQMLHKKELQEISSWWKELDFASKLPYARDRVVECFFWTVGVYPEPQFSRARIMLAKTIAIVSVTDDTYDAYATMEELDILTKAIERWDLSEIDHLPEYIRPFYKALIKLYEQFEEELTREGRSYATSYSIEALKELVRCYHVEAKWIIEGYLPSFDEYLKNALITCTYGYLKASSLLGCKSALKEDFEWLNKKPKMFIAGLMICRVVDDVATYEIEKERGQLATGIECYMSEKGVAKEEAENKFLEMATNAWKDINEECLKPYDSCGGSRDVRMKILNFARLIDVTYKNNEDGYSHPEKVLKPHIVALFVDPIKINN